MKVRIPKRFPAGDKVYRIRCTKRHDDEMDMAELDGLARHGARMEVLIRSGLDPQALQETLVHEVLHCEDTQYNPSGKRLSEDQVSGLAHGMAQFLKSIGVEFTY